MKTYKKSRKRKRFWKSLRARSGYILLLVFAISAPLVLFRYTQQWRKNLAAEITALEAALDSCDMLKEPDRYLSIDRALNYKHLEPLLYFSLLSVPCCMAIFAMIIIYQYSGRQQQPRRTRIEPWKPTRIQIDGRRRKKDR